MKVLFDHNVPRKLRTALDRHSVNTAREMGWEKMANGLLLRAAEEAGFEVFVTADQNVSYQQNLKDRKLALVVLSNNDWNVVKANVTAVAYSVDSSTRGSFHYVNCR